MWSTTASTRFGAAPTGPPARRRSVPMIHGLSVARRSRTIVALAFPLLLCVGAARAQTARLSGVVTDSAGGYPVSGASISILGTNLGATTSDQGQYSFAAVPPGRYT